MSRSGGRARRLVEAAALVAAATLAWSATGSVPVAGASGWIGAGGGGSSPSTTVPGAPASVAATIAGEQADVVALAYRAAVTAAQQAATSGQELASLDEAQLGRDRQAATAAVASVTDHTAALAATTSALAAAATAVQAAAARLAIHRAQLKGIALDLYTGGLAGPTDQSIQQFAGDQEEVLDRAEVDVVEQETVTEVHADTDTLVLARVHHQRLADQLGTEQGVLAYDQRTAADAAAQSASAAAAWAAAQAGLAHTQAQLASAQAAQRAAEAKVADPAAAATGGISILGPSALNATQLTNWFNWQGYADLTPASIQQLAGWYVQQGAVEGVRGDLAFAQAVLETGGFSSGDAMELNNYAGIGHCDSCAQGWPFPSPQGGVVGQLQLLRIFADPGGPPVAAPGPVLPQLTAANQFRAGCCSTWESLTGVWASDPRYGNSILATYQDMLTYALGSSS